MSPWALIAGRASDNDGERRTVSRAPGIANILGPVTDRCGHTVPTHPSWSPAPDPGSDRTRRETPLPHSPHRPRPRGGLVTERVRRLAEQERRNPGASRKRHTESRSHAWRDSEAPEEIVLPPRPWADIPFDPTRLIAHLST